MRTLDIKETNKISGGRAPTGSQINPNVIKGPQPTDPDPIPTTYVTAPYPSNPPPTERTEPSDPSTGGGGGTSSSPTFGNLLPPTDTPEHRREVVEQAEEILDDLGYHVPGDYTVSYTDYYVFQDNQTKEYRYSLSKDTHTGEREVYGYTTPDGNIAITRFSVSPDRLSPDDPNPNDGLVSWDVLENSQGEVSLNGTQEHTVFDGGITPLENTVGQLAHEIYHADMYEHDRSHRDTTMDELKARTQGYLVKSHFDELVKEGM